MIFDFVKFSFRLIFPAEFPFKPPSIYMTTPSGRFKTNTRLCLSISDYHPDTWNPAWSVSTILTGKFDTEITDLFSQSRVACEWLNNWFRSSEFHAGAKSHSWFHRDEWLGEKAICLQVRSLMMLMTPTERSLLENNNDLRENCPDSQLKPFQEFRI